MLRGETAGSAPVRRQQSRSTPAQFWHTYHAGILFLLPAIVLYIVFMVYPFFQSIYLSMTSWDGAQQVKQFVGLDNYVTLVQDPVVWTSLQHNVTWVVIGTIVPIVIGLFLAVLVSHRPRGFLLFRTIYFMPQVLPSVIIAIIWGWVYNPFFGILNQALTTVGLSGLTRSWLGDPSVALYAVLGTAVWGGIGFVFVVVLAGLQNVSVDLLDAATVDGANAWQRFWYVTLPELSHVLTMLIVLSLIGGFSAFDTVFILTQGGPNNATQLIATYAY